MTDDSIRLILLDSAAAEALASSATFRERYRAEVGRAIDVARDATRQTLEFQRRIGSEPPWVGYLAVEESSKSVVGACGFKGKPTAEATVEIAYFTFPAFEGRGFATAMAGKLIEIAQRDPAAPVVIAHTLAEINASTRVLEKSGFRNLGEVVDPEDGTVWQWRLER